MTELFKGLEVARKEFNNYQGNAYLYVDFDDMTAWTLVGNHVEYDSKTISRVVFKNDLNDRDARYGKEKLNAILKSLINFKNAGNDVYTDSDDFYRFYANDGLAAYANGTIIEF